MPKVSIITPCYNSSKFLAETIQSVINQTFTDWEWIITDDNSKDKSVEIIKSFQNDKIILIESKTNGGAGHARNLALEKASGRYITFLDADDFWESNFLEEMVAFMEQENAELA
ncbi:MAG: glycosyltransferase family 2 protein, partial [Bergeyella zoohelcum]|nr:glycosyltransferase family 2 protein [Bergeyella zoohelcum]